MAAAKIGTGRAVEVLHDRGPSVTAGTDRWTAGSGYLIGGRLVLTAAHNVDYRRSLGDDQQLLVRRIDGSELAARVVLVCDEPSKVDLALLEIIDPGFDEICPPVTIARVNRDSPAPVVGCWAVGFPRFGEAGPVLAEGSRKETWHVRGEILPGGKLRAGLFSLQVTSKPRGLPTSLAGSEWEGMSGAVVFATDPHEGELAVGVVTTHHRAEGESALAVVPITAIAGLPTDARWWRRLGVPDPGALSVLPRQLSSVGVIPLAQHGRLENVRQYADGLVAKLDLPHFTGREWLLGIVDDFLHSEDRGYFVLEADAGLGKTTFCAWLARIRRYPVHFVQIPGGADPEAALKNLAVQLIDIYQLDEFAPGGVLSPAIASPNGFERLLAEAANQTQQDGRPLVLVVDGLDEVPHRVGEMPFGLPASLPLNVYLVLSRRPGGQMLPAEPPRRYFTLQARAEPGEPPVPNQQDMLDYLRRVADEPPLAGLLAAAGLSADVFAGQLAAKCAGVWIYLYYVLDQMRRRLRLVTDLDTLPDTLWQYYARTFAPSRYQDPDRWQAVLLPLLATLGAVREPVTFELLCTLAGVQPDERWRMVLDGPWRPFLQVIDDNSLDAEPRYAVYHDSLRDFLDGRLAEDALAQMTAERPLIRQLRRALRDRHHAIANRYLSGWGGLDQGLPELTADPGLAGLDGGYALRWLVTHLIAAGSDAELHRLLASGRHERNIWFIAHYHAGDVAGYLRDVGQARGRTQGFGMQLRYALVQASIASLPTTLSPGLIGELVTRDLWTASHAFSLIEQMADERRQAQLLTRIAPHLPKEHLGLALAVAMRCRDHETRASALEAVIPHLPGHLLEDAADAIFSINYSTGLSLPPIEGDPDSYLAPMVTVFAGLPKGLLQELPRRYTSFFNCVYVPAVYSLFTADDRIQGARDALGAARAVENTHMRGLLVAALIPHLPPEAFDDILAVLRTTSYLDDSMIALAEHAPDERMSDVLEFAQGKWHPHPGFFRHAARRLNAGQLPAALRLCKAVTREEERAEAFAALAPLLEVEQSRRLLAWDRSGSGHRPVIVNDLNLHFEEPELIVMNALLDRLPPEEARHVVSEQIIPYISMSRTYESELPLLGSHLPDELRPRALERIYQGLRWPGNAREENAALLTRFIPLSEEEVTGAFDQAQAHSRSEAFLSVADVLAPHLPDRLLYDALTRVTAFPLERECFAALAALGRLQPEQARDQTAQRCLAMAANISHMRSRANAVAALMPVLTRLELAATAFTILWSVDPSWGVRAMEEMADVLPAERKYSEVL